MLKQVRLTTDTRKNFLIVSCWAEWITQKSLKQFSLPNLAPEVPLSGIWRDAEKVSDGFCYLPHPFKVFWKQTARKQNSDWGMKKLGRSPGEGLQKIKGKGFGDLQIFASRLYCVDLRARAVSHLYFIPMEMWRWRQPQVLFRAIGGWQGRGRGYRPLV